MARKRKNEAQTDIDIYNYLTNERVYSNSWEVHKTINPYVQTILDSSSKAGTGKRGEPDLIYVNESNKLLILIENKNAIKDHESTSKDKPKRYAVDGVLHYLSAFTSMTHLKESVKKYFKGWSIVGIAFSGDINDEYNHLISTFIISEGQISDIETKEILDEDDYLSFFRNIDVELITKNISKSSSEINRKLRSIDSQRRPILLSALMICLYDKGNFPNNFKSDYSRWTTQNIIRNIPTTIQDILQNEGISRDKVEVLVNELAFINTEKDLNNTDILKNILTELEDNVIPLFNQKTNYDIIGKFYEEFLRYAGIANVKKGIVLTPSHITELFTDLIDIKTNDVILDTCCGTGAFLITGMNKIISQIQHSSQVKQSEKIGTVKNKQLIGFEKSSTMYSLAISNMLFRGDGKSKIYNIDAFSEEATQLITSLKNEGIAPTIGFINPPYGGSDNQKNPTKKEIQFLEQLLNIVSRYVVIIAPLSTFFKDELTRNRILSKHTLKYVINMPGDLFQPNASTHTAIAVFATHTPHDNKEVVFYDLKDDGYVLSKNRGRTDVFNKWEQIKKHVLTKIKNPSKYDDINLVRTPIKPGDEWIIQAHAKTDYSMITQKTFERSIKEYIIFSTKMKLGILDKDIDELTLLEILNENQISAADILNEDDNQ